MDNSSINEGADSIVARTADIVAAYVTNNVVPTAEIGRLIADVHAALSFASAQSTTSLTAEKQKPAISVRKSIQDDYIVCLECGASFKSVKRHLMTHHALSPQEYREKWDLPADYPMVSPSYAETRSVLAKEMGLGKKFGHRR
jgi:predicted transcriptional regulator